MCGIAVILPSAGGIDVPDAAIRRMTAALRHRGPDGQACLRLPGCHLGHTRLSVIDPAGGHQPMTDPTGRFTVTFNGEIYNYRALRRELERDGVAFRTHSDTEVLLLAYRQFGPAVLSRLNGQFAFAVWDAVERKLFAARDRFGEKPLFWARSPQGHLLLASEIKSILASGLIAARIDRLSVDAYLGLFYVPSDRTIYENVHPLAPAHAAEFTESGVRTWRYWQPALSCHDVDATQAIAEVRSRIDRAVERQLVADVPVGAFLSGGLDSSTIVALMSQRRGGGEPVRTFSVGFGDLIDELPYAREVASKYRTDHHELQMNIEVGELAQRMGEVYDEPFADSSNIPTYLVAEFARRGVRVVLSGDGGDELFGGYGWYSSLLNGADSREPPESAETDWWARHVASATHLFADRAALWGVGRQPAAAQTVRQGYKPAGDCRAMDRATHFDLACYLPGDILAKVDRAAMAHGLETRCPFLDVDLAEFVLGLPWQLRFRDAAAGSLKWLLREACGDLWPPSLRTRGKQGFGAPVRHWLQRPDVQALWQRVTRPDGPLAALLPGAADATVLEPLRPQRRWTLLCLGLWLEGQGRTQCLRNL